MRGIPPPNSVPVARVLTSQIFILSAIAPHGEIRSATLEIEVPVWKFDKEVTIWLMQKDSKLPGLEDTLEYWNQFMISSFSKNMKIDPDYGHVFLVLLATTVKVESNKAPDLKQTFSDSEPSGSGLGPDPNRKRYSLSGLVLGPVVGTTHSDLKYERLARFTSI
ncbi:hypothetical protein CJF32_00011375 [Rutstroemia sp. NJR-2017a WRK4]|nr:hypothetical protein CJF32_00011375 [Rutstroemia sp. NJR-2017a WRK4]